MGEIEKWIEGVKSDLVKSYRNKKLRASGNFERQLTTKVETNGRITKATLLGVDYGYYMEHGRGVTKRAGTGVKLIDVIKEWIKVKGLSHLNPYAVTKKIHEEGIKVPNKYNPGKVISSVINDKMIDKFLDDYADKKIISIHSEILKTWQ